MNEPKVLTAAQMFVFALDQWKGPNDDWRRLEVREGTARVEELIPVWRWLADQVINANGRVLPASAPLATKYLTQTANDLDPIGHFDIAKDNARQEFRQQLSNVERNLHEVLDEIGIWACQHAARRANDEPTGKMSDLLREAEQKLEQIRNHEREAKDHAREGKAATESIKSAAVAAGAAVFTDSFKKSAQTARQASQKWLLAGAVFAAVTMAVAGTVAVGWPGGGQDNGTDAWTLLQPLAGRLFLLTVLTYVTVWCGRRSLAERHNSRVNDHRANSIQTIQAFRESANAEPTKDAVVLEAARAIFENVDTGDLGTSPERPSISNIIDLVRPSGG